MGTALRGPSIELLRDLHALAALTCLMRDLIWHAVSSAAEWVEDLDPSRSSQSITPRVSPGSGYPVSVSVYMQSLYVFLIGVLEST